MEYSCITDVGLLREKNQDSYLVSKNNDDDLFAIVADGIGGGRAGEVASSEVVKHFDSVFKKSSFKNESEIQDYLIENIAVANTNIYYLSKTYLEYRGMGTTVTGILFHNDSVLTFNCGDSRVYGFLDRKTFHLTYDHTLVNQMLENKEITPQEAENHPKKHYLTRAVGIFRQVEVDVHPVKQMEYYLVCSDGLHGMLKDDEIVNIVYDEEKTLDERVEALKDLALLKGGYDNITAILIKR